MKPIAKVKLTTTIYFDYDGEYWDTCSPKNDYPWMRLGEDYAMLRKGNILNVYAYEDWSDGEEAPDSERKYVLIGPHGNIVFSESIEDSCWWEVI